MFQDKEREKILLGRLNQELKYCHLPTRQAVFSLFELSIKQSKKEVFDDIEKVVPTSWLGYKYEKLKQRHLSTKEAKKCQ